MANEIKSEFALLDVLGKKRCEALERRLKKGGPIEVVIRGKILDASGDYDGMSMEFNCEVISVEEATPPDAQNNTGDERDATRY